MAEHFEQGLVCTVVGTGQTGEWRVGTMTPGQRVSIHCDITPQHRMHAGDRRGLRERMGGGALVIHIV